MKPDKVLNQRSGSFYVRDTLKLYISHWTYESLSVVLIKVSEFDGGEFILFWLNIAQKNVHFVFSILLATKDLLLYIINKIIINFIVALFILQCLYHPILGTCVNGDFKTLFFISENWRNYSRIFKKKDLNVLSVKIILILFISIKIGHFVSRYKYIKFI